MKCRSWIFACVLSMTTIAAQAQTAESQTNDSPDLDPEALEILKEMAEYLASASTFSLEIAISYDVVQASGLTVEFGATRKALVSRPNKMRADFHNRDGDEGFMLFDGDHIWIYQPDEKVYAKTEQEADLDEAIDFAIAELRIKAPTADILSPDLYDNLTNKLTRAWYLGAADLDGVECEHLLMSNDYVDFQMWIATGDQPVLQRIVITYREEEGHPQYRAQYRNWNMSPKITRDSFKFEPPDDSERIRFFVPVAADSTQE